jgi:hypothetical protein
MVTDLVHFARYVFDSDNTTYIVIAYDLIQYRNGAVSLDACKNHDHKIYKYLFFHR